MSEEVPTLSNAAVIKLAALCVHASNLIDDLYMGDQTAQLRGMRLIRDILSDHEILALRLALDRQNLLPPKR